VPSTIKPEKLQQSLETKIFGKRILIKTEVNSTNELASQLASKGAAEGTVVLALTQSAGRGRLSRSWISPSGGLWLSVILRPKIKAIEASKLTFIASLSVAEVLREQYRLNAETKWPNDVLVNGKKICGVLAKMITTGESVEGVILGIGLNANFPASILPKLVRTDATSIESELGKEIILQELFAALMKKLEETYKVLLKEGSQPVLSRWKTCSGFLGKKLVVTESFETFRGTALDVDGDGALILVLDDGTKKRIYAGDIMKMNSQVPSNNDLSQGSL
jgi:BirA family biotin operon repressor/biotin-[acetyl-CoA-carboxylase] ligase